MWLVAAEGADQQPRADSEHGDAGGDFARIVLRDALRFLAVAAHVVACGVQVLLHIDVLQRGFDVVDRFIAHAELAEELFHSAIDGLSAMRADFGALAAGHVRLTCVCFSVSTADRSIHWLLLFHSPGSYFRWCVPMRGSPDLF